jgi:hypothetical protein
MSRAAARAASALAVLAASLSLAACGPSSPPPPVTYFTPCPSGQAPAWPGVLHGTQECEK